jgi:hypothetical protein
MFHSCQEPEAGARTRVARWLLAVGLALPTAAVAAGMAAAGSRRITSLLARASAS